MGQLWIWISICAFAFYTTTVLSDPISVVYIGEEDDSVAKTALRAGFGSGSETEIKFEVISVSSEKLSEMSVCSEIFTAERKPHLVIDVSKDMNVKMLTDKKSEIVKSVLRKMGAPTVSLTSTIFPWPGVPLTDAEKEYIIKIIPPDLVISNVVKSVSDVIRANKIGVVYDMSFPFTNKVGLLFDNIPSAVAMVPLSMNLKSEVENVGVSDVGNFFLFGNNQNISSVLNEASKQNFVSKEFSWYTISKDGADLTPTVNQEFSVVHFKPKAVNTEMEKDLTQFTAEAKVDSAFYYDLATILRAYLLENVGKEGSWSATWTYPECSEEIAVTEEMVAERANVKLKTWLEARENSKNLKGTFGDFTLKIPPGSRRTYGHQNIKMEVEELKLNSNGVVKKSTDLVWQYKADATKPSDFFTGPLDVIKNHKGTVVLRVTTVVEPPFMYKNVVNGKVTWDGYLIELIELLKKEAKLTFDYRITENKGKVHGTMIEHPNRNVTWDGMIGDLVNGKADLALGAFAVMSERELFVDFTVPFYDMVGISILMKRIKPETSLFKFLSVLETNVWGCIVSAYFFTSFLLFIFDRLSPYSFYNNQEKFKDDPDQRDFSLKESLWFCFTSLTPQGGGEAPRNLSGRLVAATWWLFGFIIIASYTANLAAFLTVSRLDSTIESLEDLARQYKIKYASVEGSTAHKYFERMAAVEERFYEIWKNMSLDDTLNETERAKLAVWDYPVTDKFTKIWWTMKETGFYTSLEDGINKTLKSIKGEGHALLAEATQVQYATMLDCDLREVGNQFSRKPLALALPKGSPYLEALSAAILKLMNERVLEQLKDKWWNQNPYLKKCQRYEKRNDGIEYENIGGIFYVMGGGIMLATISLMAEYIYFKSKLSTSRVVMVKDYSSSSAGKARRELKR